MRITVNANVADIEGAAFEDWLDRTNHFGKLDLLGIAAIDEETVRTPANANLVLYCTIDALEVDFASIQVGSATKSCARETEVTIDDSETSDSNVAIIVWREINDAINRGRYENANHVRLSVGSHYVVRSDKSPHSRDKLDSDDTIIV